MTLREKLLEILRDHESLNLKIDVVRPVLIALGWKRGDFEDDYIAKSVSAKFDFALLYEQEGAPICFADVEEHLDDHVD